MRDGGGRLLVGRAGALLETVVAEGISRERREEKGTQISCNTFSQRQNNQGFTTYFGSFDRLF